MTGFGDEPPGVRRRAVVVVTGPPAAGSGAVLARLQDRLPAHRFVAPGELADGEAPVLVVFVVSGVAPVTESDCAVAHRWTRHTAALVGVVAKIDDHRAWRAVLAADRAALADLGEAGWVGAAAAPRVGPPQVEDLVDAVAAALADPMLATRNRLRAWHFELGEALAGHRAEAARHRDRTEALQRTRRELLRDARRDRTERTIVRRETAARARLELAAAVQRRCAQLRDDLTALAAGAGRRDLADVADRVRADCAAAFAAFAEWVDAELPGPADAPADPPDLAAPRVPARGLETRLMTVLGAGFGLGVAWALTRLLAGVAPGATVAAVSGGLVAGAAVTIWVVRARGLLHERALLERWIAQSTQTLRGAAERVVADRWLAVESALASAAAAEDAAAARRLADLDAELRSHRRDGDAAAAARDCACAALDRRLEALSALRFGAADGYPSVAIAGGSDLNRSGD
ncbi:hypothetical protein [Mycolicibacterium vaccae]|uniref:hypothetical protein n=1 Tax=Mycolicibacterium vaccae TaxID=1810 RepID=UPI003D03246E